MSEMLDPILLEQATSEELSEVISEMELYRERLVNDTLTMAQRAKVHKSKAIADLEPSLAKIDANLEALRRQFAVLTSSL